MPAAAPAPFAAPASPFWADWRAPDFDRLAASPAAARAVAVLPVAACEQHGPHLPLSVDTTLLDGVIAAALPHLAAGAHAAPVLFLPTQQVGFSPEHLGFRGTLSLRAETLLRVWTELAECVAAAGIRRLVLLNGHGGQVGLLDPVARDLRQRLGLLVVSTSWFQLPLPTAVEALFPPHEHRFGVHAGDVETSMMLALAPGRVDMAQAADFTSTSATRAAHSPVLGNGRSARFAWAAQDLNPAGAAGNAAAATAQKGHAMLQAAGAALAALLGEVVALPAHTLQPPPAG